MAPAADLPQGSPHGMFGSAAEAAGLGRGPSLQAGFLPNSSTWELGGTMRVCVCVCMVALVGYARMDAQSSGPPPKQGTAQQPKPCTKPTPPPPPV